MFLQNKILDNLNSLAIIVNSNFEIIYISPSVNEILGFNPNELLGNNWWLKTKNSQAEIDYSKKKLNGFNIDSDSHEKRTYESKIRTKWGNSKWILWNISINNDDEIIAIGNDITKRKEYEVLLEKKTNK